MENLTLPFISDKDTAQCIKDGNLRPLSGRRVSQEFIPELERRKVDIDENGNCWSVPGPYG